MLLDSLIVFSFYSVSTVFLFYSVFSVYTTLAHFWLFFCQLFVLFPSGCF